MSKFNATKINTRKTTTHAGGLAYNKTLENEWTNMLFSCLLQDGYYESSDDFQQRYIDLTTQMIDKYGAAFVGKAAVYARNELGMRSVSELTAALVNRFQFEGKRQFYSKYFHRPDGVGEVFGAIDMLGDKRSHALIRGCADYLSTLSPYQITKYKMNSKTYNMHDLINITHAYSSVIDDFQNGRIKSADTWENSISNAESVEHKEQEWKRLVEEHKLGYLALLRNLRNILQCEFVTEEWIEEQLVPQIVNKISIEKSLIFPYQIYTAWKISGASMYPILESALSDAFRLATKNMPKFDGKSAIIVDVSGSMDSPMSRNSAVTIKEVSCCYAAAFYLSENNDIDIYKFGNDAKKVEPPHRFVNVFKFIQTLEDNEGLGYGTVIVEAFNCLDEHYDRLFLFSDMQVMDNPWGWGGNSYARERFNQYRSEFGDSHIYSFDLGNASSQITSDDSRISYITTISDKVFDILHLINQKDFSLIDVIKNYNY